MTGSAKAPAAADLSGRVLLSGRAASFTALLGPMAKAMQKIGAGFRQNMAGKVASEILSDFPSMFDMRMSKGGLHHGKPVALAILGPPGIGKAQSFSGRAQIQAVILASKGPRWKQALLTLSRSADEVFESPWGARGFRLGPRATWVWTQGDQVVLATDAGLLTGGAKLLRPHRVKALKKPSHVFVNAKIDRVGRLFVAGLRAGLSSMPSVGPLKTIRNQAMGLLEKVRLFTASVEDLELALSVNKTTGYDLTARITGANGESLHRWIRDMKTLDTRRLGFFPSKAFISSAEISGDVFRGGIMGLLAPSARLVTRLMGLKGGKGKSSKLAKKLETVVDALETIWKSRAGFSAQSMRVDPKTGLQALWVEEVAKPKAFYRALKSILRKAPALASLLSVDVLEIYKRLPRRRSFGSVVFRSRRVRGTRVQVATVSWGKHPVRQRGLATLWEAFWGRSLSIAFARRGRYVFIAAGNQWKKTLSQILKKWRKGPPKASAKATWLGTPSKVRATAKISAGDKINHALVLSMGRLWTPLFQRVANLHRKRAKAAKKAGRTREARRHSLLARGMSSMLRRMPKLKGRAVVTTKTKGRGVLWTVSLPADEIVSWAFPLFGMIRASGRGPAPNPAVKRGTKAVSPPGRTP